MANPWLVAPSGSLDIHNVTNLFGIRPVINLRSDIKMAKGDGTALNPYVVSLD